MFLSKLTDGTNLNRCYLHIFFFSNKLFTYFFRCFYKRLLRIFFFWVSSEFQWCHLFAAAAAQVIISEQPIDKQLETTEPLLKFFLLNVSSLSANVLFSGWFPKLLNMKSTLIWLFKIHVSLFSSLNRYA